VKTADIVTTHNVVIQYEIAPVISRIVANILDMIIVFFYLTIIELLFKMIFSGFGGFDDFDNIVILFLYMAMIPGFFYSFFCEALFGGQTVGKMAMGTKVVNVDGSKPSIGDFFLRWIFRLTDNIISVGGFALLISLSNERGQRLGDVVANTMVIKLRPSKEFSIIDILNIKSTKDYKPTYPMVTKFTDEDMLLIKNSLERLKKIPNDAHKALVREICDKTVLELGLSEAPKKKVSFLKVVLQDYIVLTRS